MDELLAVIAELGLELHPDRISRRVKDQDAGFRRAVRFDSFEFRPQRR